MTPYNADELLGALALAINYIENPRAYSDEWVQGKLYEAMEAVLHAKEALKCVNYVRTR